MLLYNTICTSLTNIQLEQLCDTTTRQEKILVSLQFSYSTTVFFCVFEIDPILRRTQSRGIAFTMRGPNQNCNSQSVVYGAFKFCGFFKSARHIVIKQHKKGENFSFITVFNWTTVFFGMSKIDPMLGSRAIYSNLRAK